MKSFLAFAIVLAAALLSGCSSYITPGHRADLSSFTDSNLEASFAAKPAAQFPAGITFVRVQDPSYYSYNADQLDAVWGEGGRYSVITARELDEDRELDRVRNLTKVAGVIGLNRLLLPDYLNSDRELREAAARLQSDLLVVYTFETSFRDQNRSVPLTTISLGATRTKHVTIQVTASALVVDTRTGFIYAALETNERREVNASLWSERQKADNARIDAERAAFKSLIDDFERSWGAIVDRARSRT